MKALVKLYVKKLFTKKILFLIIGVILFSLEERLGGQLSKEQFIFNTLTDHYYLTYFMIPMFILIIYGSLNEDMEYVLIRSGSYWRYFKGKAIAYLIFSSIFVAIQILVLFILSIGLRGDYTFAIPNNSIYELLLYYSSYFNNIIQGILVVSIYMVIGLFILALIFISINHFFTKKTSAKIIIFLYILMNLGLKIPNLNNIPGLFIDNYIIFHRNFNYDFKLITNIITTILIFIGICILNKYFWNKTISFKWNISRGGVFKYYKKILISKKNIYIIFGVLILMSFWKLLKGVGTYDTLNDYLVNIFMGHSVNTIVPIDFLEMLVLNLAPIYILSVFLEKESNERTLFINIRLNRVVNILDNIFKISLYFISIYTLLNIVIPILIGLFNNLPIERGFINLGVSIFIIKFLDLLFQFLVLLLVYSIFENITLAFISIMVFNGICFLPFIWIKYLPFGISSLSRLEYLIGYSESKLYLLIVIMLILNILLYIFLRIYKYKKVIIK